MKILIIAEHDNKSLKPITLSCVTAAKKIGDNIELLILGSDCSNVSENAKKLSSVKKVTVFDDKNFKYQISDSDAVRNIVFLPQESVSFNYSTFS